MTELCDSLCVCHFLWLQELDKKHLNGPDFKYRVFWMRVLGSGPEWHTTNTTAPPFIVKDVGVYSSFNIKVQSVNEEGEGPELYKQVPFIRGRARLRQTFG